MRSKLLEPDLLLESAIAVVTLGMVLIAIGVISGPFFYPGLFVLIAGFLLTITAGVLYTLPRSADGAKP